MRSPALEGDDDFFDIDLPFIQAAARAESPTDGRST
jgi:hypothetical protein